MASRAAENVRRIGQLLMAAAVCAWLSFAGPVSASNWSGATGGTGCTANNRADSAAHGFYYVSMSPRNAGAMDWARTNVLDPTHINTYSDSNTSTTDVVVSDDYYSTLCGFTWFNPASSPNGVVGLAACESLSWGDTCESFNVFMNQYFTDISALDYVQALAAHEAGHTLGLLHRTSGNTVMQQGYPKPSRFFDDHDRDLHLNIYY